MHVCVAGFDYVPVGQELEFVASGAQVGCVSVHTLADSLAEGKEWFGIQLSVEPQSLVHLITEKLKLTIEPSDGMYKQVHITYTSKLLI